MTLAEEFVANHDVEEFKKYYCSHSDKDVLQFYDLNKNRLAAILQLFGIKLTNDEKRKRRELNALDLWGVSLEEHQKQINQKRDQTNLVRYGTSSPAQLQEFKDKAKTTCIKKFGVDNPAKAGVVKDQVKKTNLERYGCESFLSSPEYRKRFEDITEERHGYRNPFQSAEKQKSIKQLIQATYGVDNVFQSDKVKQKSRETCIEKYGVPYVSQTQEFKKKVSDTSISRYGVPNPAQSDQVKERITETNQRRYGVNWTGQVPQFRENAEQTCLDRYGSEYPVNDKFRRVIYTYDGIQFDSSNELYYYIWATENNRDIQRCTHSYEYHVGNRVRHYTPDFVVDGEDVEIKGKHFFDADGNLINPFTSNLSIQAIYKAKGVCMHQHGVQVITDISEQKRYVDEKYTSNYVPLFREGIEFPYLNANLKVTTHIGLIQHFHKSIYAAHREDCISPIEAWKDKDLVKKSALNRLKYVHSCRPADVIQGFNVAKFAPKVSVFSPKLAAELIEKYVTTPAIVDPFSGFSGRMLGALQRNKRYKGFDINEVHVAESNEIIHYLRAENQLSVLVKDLLATSVANYKNTTLFTCPPYNLKEQWNDVETNLSCDDWIDLCIEKYKCDAYLFVVDNTNKYQHNIVETITNKSHFGANNEYVVLINGNLK